MGIKGGEAHTNIWQEYEKRLKEKKEIHPCTIYMERS